ncbi:helix-turn-helix transcriptional regulator [Demequina iriomotensis]|uniref:helix-turn-helix transcriptional regulator n=1 Tax=Demequina iriomotensis TaxID=1536641 RepID=UPI0007817DE4|nr:WYL domain-containing protein [Demequina iriomotensis]
MAGVGKSQRLLNLIIGLSSTRHRLTRDQIRDTIEGYDPLPYGASDEDRAKAEASFERMFERDKKELRELGVPIETVEDPVHGDEIGYRIRPAEAAMPALDLTAAELAVVSIAADYWRGAVLGGDAHQAVMKLASSAEHGPRVELPFAALPAVSSEAFGVLVEAVADRQTVRFEYSSVSSGAGTRTVDPWRVVLRAGVAYVIGFDRDREAPRTFRVQRIGGAVRTVGAPGAFTVPADIPLGALAESEDLHEARVALRPESGHALRRRGDAAGVDDGWELYDVTYAHGDALVAEVLALAGGARIVAPKALADAVVKAASAALEVESA